MPALDRFSTSAFLAWFSSGLCAWLIRKAMKAARTERDLEEERLEGRSRRSCAPAGSGRRGHTGRTWLRSRRQRPRRRRLPWTRSRRGRARCDPAHLPLVAGMVREREQLLRAQQVGPADVERRIEVLWVRSNATHAVWCERRRAATSAAKGVTREVICVAQIEDGTVVERWSFG